MKIERYSEPWAARWDKLVMESDDAWLMHTRGFCDAVTHGYKMLERSLMATEGERLLAILPLHATKTHGELRSTGMGLAGPALLNDLPAESRKRILESLMAQAAKEASRAHVQKLVIFVNALASTSLEGRGPRALPCMNEAVHEPTCILRTQRPYAELASGFSSSARGSLRKAERAGVRVEEVDALESLHGYYAAHKETYERTGVQPHPLAFFEHIFRLVNARGWARLLRARIEGRVVAWLNVAWFKNAAWYWSGCSTAEGLESGANYKLQAHAIEMACQSKLQVYEVGQVFPEAKTGKLAGLTLFKTRFGKETLNHTRFEREIAPTYYKIRRRVGAALRGLGLRR